MMIRMDKNGDKSDSGDGDGDDYDFRSIASAWDLIKTTGQHQSRQHSETLSVLRPLHKNKRQFINSWYIVTRIKWQLLTGKTFSWFMAIRVLKDEDDKV